MSAAERERDRLARQHTASAIMLHGTMVVLNGLVTDMNQAASRAEELSIGALILSALGDLKRAAAESERATAAVLAHEMRQAGMTEVRTDTHTVALSDVKPPAKPRPFSNEARSPLTLSRTVH